MALHTECHSYFIASSYKLYLVQQRSVTVVHRKDITPGRESGYIEFTAILAIMNLATEYILYLYPLPPRLLLGQADYATALH